jgi:hypothetical protein
MMLRPGLRAEVTGQVRPIGHDGLDAAEVKGVLVTADALNLHFVAELAFGRVGLPFSDERSSAAHSAP